MAHMLATATFGLMEVDAWRRLSSCILLKRLKRRTLTVSGSSQADLNSGIRAAFIRGAVPALYSSVTKQVLMLRRGASHASTEPESAVS